MEHILLLLLLLAPLGVPADDIACLRAFRNSVEDPTGYLNNWDFENTTSSTGNVCYFRGVSCVHFNEASVYELKLPSAGLRGTFPEGLGNCTSLSRLDLSGNKFTGPIPDTLCADVPNMIMADLSENGLGGSIPYSLGQCLYVNELFLQSNSLTGSIPASIGQLNRLNMLDVSDNLLSGQIPDSLKHVGSVDFSNNPGLCGALVNRSCASGSSSKGTNTGLIAGIAIGVAVAVVAFVALAIWWWLSTKPAGNHPGRDDNRWIKRIKAPRNIVVSMFEKPIVKIKLADLMVATNHFSQSNIIQSGRTGTVYKGILPDGSVMAIKRLQVTPHSDRQFRAEMETLGRLKHRNLVPLLGFCIADQERLLVYKHMPNGSLFEHLRGAYEGNYDQVGVANVEGHHDLENGSGMKSGEKKFDWPIRVKIAIGAARGLAWLHHSCNPRVIHRNISAGCILLDEEFEAKISDFGLARLMNPVDTHISTFVNGDFGDVGYVAPEYVRTLVATVKGDVFSFGVVLLELVTGQKPVDVADDNFRGNLAEWLAHLSNTGNVGRAIDKALIGKGSDDELMQFLKVASACVSVNPKERPSMYEVFHMLRTIGQKYHFSDENDDIPMATDTEDLGTHDLIVSKS